MPVGGHVKKGEKTGTSESEVTYQDITSQTNLIKEGKKTDYDLLSVKGY